MMVKFKANSFGLKPQEVIPIYLESGDNFSTDIIVESNFSDLNSKLPPDTPIQIEAGIKTNIDVFAFKVPLMLSILFVKQNTLVNNNELMQLWESIPNDPSQNYEFKSISGKLNSPSKIKERLIDNNVYFLEEG